MLDTSDHNAKYESEDNDMPAYNQIKEMICTKNTKDSYQISKNQLLQT